MTSLAPIAQQIWDMKYRLKTPEGAPVDETVEATWARIAEALAEPEKPANRARYSAQFLEALQDFRFLPAGRIIAGAGTGRKVTLFNCFVMGTVPDDMGGIFEGLREAALTMQQGGGIGYDFSTLRPRGAPVKGVGADASGPLSFMDVWDAMCRTIMSAGSRRGAMMATLRCDHPDIEAFIEAKADPARLRMFNLSVLVTDAFMRAVENDAAWDLVFAGRTYKTVPARQLWDRIMRATYAQAEPGVIFIDRINQRNNLHYCETIAATNPCVTADTWVQTGDGPRQVADLLGRPFTAIVNGQPFASGDGGFFATGRKPTLRLRTREGFALTLTADHPVRRVTSRTRYSIAADWTPAAELSPGDRILLNDHREAARWLGLHGDAEGYLLGLLVGDGTLKKDKAVLSVWKRPLAVNGDAVDGVDGVMLAALAAARALRHRADFSGWVAVSGRNEYRLTTAAVKSLALDLGMSPGDKRIGPAIERCSFEFYCGFLRGLFDADGTVIGSQAKGVSIRLWQHDLPRLETVQRMLLRLGIVSTIYRDRKAEGLKSLPDGCGGTRAYAVTAGHELVIANANVLRFADLVGFADSEKAARLNRLIAGYRRLFNRERFLAEVDSLELMGEADVYDVQIPGINAFDANGLLVHNCGEQPLPPYGACLLGSVNLARLVARPFEAEAALDTEALERLVTVAIRMMDNTIDVSRFPLPQQQAEAVAKRRIGLGVTGLADALIMVGARYGSPEALALTEDWMRRIRDAAYRTSVQLAAEKGAFPLFDRERYLEGEMIAELPADIRAGIAEHGIRNALLTSIAPTGTISLFAGNISSGLEPVFSFTYRRAVLMPDGTRREEEVADYAYSLWRELNGDAPLPEAFVTAQTLAPTDHVAMQAVVQKYVDSSISKTINVPEDIGFEAFRDVYIQAYRSGCKGCTTYRPNAVTGSVLSLTEAKPPAEAPKPKEAGGVVYMTQPLDRPEALPGRTYKVTWPESAHAIYITVNDILQDGRRRPFEVFINSKNMEHYAWTVALTRMISAVFRRGGDITFVVEELKAVFDPRGGQWVKGRYVPSLLAAIGEVIERHMIEIGFIQRDGETPVEPGLQRLAVGAEEADGPPPGAAYCPKCAQPALMQQEGCATCLACGYSKCG